MIFLLDTSAYVGFKKGDAELLKTMATAVKIYFSTIVLGEVMFGFRHGSKFNQNMIELDRFLDHPITEMLPVDRTTADRYARIASHLRAKGSPIPTNDIWIAAQTMASGAELLTYDRHFEKVDGLVFTLY